jgi:hypothetical protein
MTVRVGNLDRSATARSALTATSTADRKKWSDQISAASASILETL